MTAVLSRVAIETRSDALVWQHVCALTSLRERLGYSEEYLREAAQLGAAFETALYDRRAEDVLERDRLKRLVQLLRETDPNRVKAAA